MANALDGLRIIEVGDGKAVGYTGKLLRDLGAEVIKVEPPQGDTLRQYGPFPDDEHPDREHPDSEHTGPEHTDPEHSGPDHTDPEHSGMFIYVHGGKRGARLDLLSEAGRTALHRLIDGADVVLHSLRPSEARERGLGAAKLLERWPALVVGALSTFGSAGPYAEWKGHGIQAYAGAGVGYRVGDPEREPLTAPLDGAELHHGAVQLAAAVMVALRYRGRSGRGQFVDIGTLEAVNVAVWGHGIAQIVYLGRESPQRHGQYLSGGGWGVFATKDGHFAIMTQVDRQWHAFLAALGDPEWSRSDLIRNMATPGFRASLSIEDGELLNKILHVDMGAELRKHTNEELWEITRRDRIAFQPVLTIPQVCESEQARVRGMLIEAPGPHPPLRVPGPPYQFAETPCRAPGPPPRLDEPSAESWADAPHEWSEPTDEPDVQPLAGLRVLDLGQVWAGPLACRYLADFGADVIKVQTTTVPWSSGVPGSTDPSDPMAWEWILRNRRSVTIDLRRPEGREIFTRLAAASDVVLENYGPRTMQRMGLTYEVLAEHNPKLVMISMPAAGSSGPWADLLSYGPTLTGLNGMKSLNGYPEDGAVLEEAAELDPTASAYGTLAILAGLAHRDRTGRGQHIELAQGEAGFAGLAEGVIEYTWNGRTVSTVGNTHRALAPHGMYPTRGDDQWIAIACETAEEWEALARTAGHEEWLSRSEFRSAADRREARHALDREIGAWSRDHDKRELTERLQEAGVAAFPVLDAMEAIADPMLRERRQDFVLHERFPGSELLNGNAWHLSASPPRLRRPAPAFGAHNVEVFGEYLGLPEDEVRRLEQDGVLV